jgi:hypothetical protein
MSCRDRRGKPALGSEPGWRGSGRTARVRAGARGWALALRGGTAGRLAVRRSRGARIVTGIGSAPAPDGATCDYTTRTAAGRRWCGCIFFDLLLDWGSPVWRHWLDRLGEPYGPALRRRGCGLSDAGPTSSVGTWVGDLEESSRHRPGRFALSRRHRARRSRWRTPRGTQAGLRSVTARATLVVAAARAAGRERAESRPSAGWTPTTRRSGTCCVLFLAARHARADGLVRRAPADDRWRGGPAL